VGERRAAWRQLCRLELQQEDGPRPEGVDGAAASVAAAVLAGVRALRETLEAELHALIGEVEALLEECLLPTAPAEAQLGYLGMRADHARYLAEFAAGPCRREAAERSLSNYQAAVALDIKVILAPPCISH
jgi:hypothetical protein